MTLNPTDPCPCDSGAPYGECCGPILSGAGKAMTATALMRSRYTAFVERRDEYLLQSWHPRTRPKSVEFNPDQRWLGLKIKSHHAGGESDEEGTVEFVARYKIQGRGHRLHEVSRFVRVAGSWVYLGPL